MILIATRRHVKVAVGRVRRDPAKSLNTPFGCIGTGHSAQEPLQHDEQLQPVPPQLQAVPELR